MEQQCTLVVASAAASAVLVMGGTLGQSVCMAAMAAAKAL
jgi:hypothetical protein